MILAYSATVAVTVSCQYCNATNTHEQLVRPLNKPAPPELPAGWMVVQGCPVCPAHLVSVSTPTVVQGQKQDIQPTVTLGG